MMVRPHAARAARDGAARHSATAVRDASSRHLARVVRDAARCVLPLRDARHAAFCDTRRRGRYQTKMRGRDGRLLSVPNSVFASKTTVNFSRAKTTWLKACARGPYADQLQKRG